jgi:excisionase family DNA binding protein
MRTSLSSAGRPAYYTVREAAWILGVEPSTVARAIRVGTLRAVRRRGRMVLPAAELAGLLSAPTDNEPTCGGTP